MSTNTKFVALIGVNIVSLDLGRYSRNEIGSDEVISDLAKSGQWDQYCFKTESSLRLLVRIDIADVSV